MKKQLMFICLSCILLFSSNSLFAYISVDRSGKHRFGRELANVTMFPIVFLIQKMGRFRCAFLVMMRLLSLLKIFLVMKSPSIVSPKMAIGTPST